MCIMHAQRKNTKPEQELKILENPKNIDFPRIDRAVNPKDIEALLEEIKVPPLKILKEK